MERGGSQDEPERRGRGVGADAGGDAATAQTLGPDAVVRGRNRPRDALQHAARVLELPAAGSPCRQRSYLRLTSPLRRRCLPRAQGAQYSQSDRVGVESGLEDDGISLKWEIARVLLIVGAVLGAVLGGAYYVGTLIDNQDPDEL